MTANPYSPPSAEVKDPPSKPWSPVKSILLGLAIDIGGSILVGIMFAIAYAIILGRYGVPFGKAMEYLHKVPSDSWLSIIGMFLGGVCSFFGGFACARVAHSSNYKLGLILAGISAGLGLLFSSDNYSVLVNSVLTALTLLSVLLGTRYGIAKNVRQGQLLAENR